MLLVLDSDERRRLEGDPTSRGALLVLDSSETERRRCEGGPVARAFAPAVVTESGKTPHYWFGNTYGLIGLLNPSSGAKMLGCRGTTPVTGGRGGGSVG